MAKRIAFGINEIVILEQGETIHTQCSEGDVAISFYDGQSAESGYGVTFVGKNMQLDSWDGAFDSAEEAVEAVQNA